MNAVTKTRRGHWADHPLHSDRREGPTERFLEFDEEARREGKSNVPMGVVVPCIGLFALLMVAVGSTVFRLLST